VRALHLISAAAAAALSLFAATAALRTDPASHLVRVRLLVNGSARITDLAIAGATLASYTPVGVRPPVNASQTGSTMRMTNAAPGTSVEVGYDAVLAGVASSAVTWTLTTSEPAATSLEVFAANNPSAPQLVDRFAFDGTTAEFTSTAARLASGESVAVTPMAPHLVLAHYYPWYTPESWRDPELLDRPLQLYSSDDPAAIGRQTEQARSAGIDAFVVSWQGRTNAMNDRRTRLVLDAAARSGMRACVYFETTVANPTADPSRPTDPKTMVQWLEDAADMYGSHPAYLRVDGRPVIFVYSASRLAEREWSRVLEAVRASGRNPVVIGDFFHSPLINVLDGEYQYINVMMSAADVEDHYRTESLRVRTFNLLRPGSARRVWVASVSPGYDDRRLSARREHVLIDRANGAVYDEQWRAATTLAADWVVITTWNEYFENTGIEPTERFGTTYLDATRKWSERFKATDLAHRLMPRSED
jgi:hypothetical protein